MTKKAKGKTKERKWRIVRKKKTCQAKQNFWGEIPGIDEEKSKKFRKYFLNELKK